MNKNIILLLIITFSFISFINCPVGKLDKGTQENNEDIQSCFLPIKYSIVVDSNDDIFIVGGFENLVSNTSNIDWFIKKINKNGIEDTDNWNKKIDGNGKCDSAYSLTFDSDDNLYIIGLGYNIISTTSGVDWWIKKFDKNGNEDLIKWNKKFDASGTDWNEVEIKSISIDSMDNVYVAGKGGNLLNNPNNYEAAWIKKFDKDGNEDLINWNKKISLNNAYETSINKVLIDDSDNVIIIGDFFAQSGYSFWWMAKYNSSGNEDISFYKEIVYYPYYGSPTSGIICENNIFIVGYGRNLVNSNSYADWVIKKFDLLGNEDLIAWNKSYNGNPNNDLDWDIAFDIKNDSFNNLYVVGSGSNLIENNSSDDWWIKKFSNLGVEDTINWNKIYNDGKSYSISIDSSNNIYIIGGENNYFIIKKFDVNGNEDLENWNKKIINQ